jgi:hypothetical protein
MLAVLFILQISILPSWGAETVLIDRLTTAEAEELNIEIPAETPPGYHEVIVQVSDDSGVLDEKILTFCKGLDGTIDWTGNCPAIAEISSAEELSQITTREDLPEYDPAQEPEKSKDLQIAAFAVLAALSAGGAAAAGNSAGNNSSSNNSGRNEDEGGETSEDDSDEASDELASVAAGSLAKIARDPGRGDLSRTWRNPYTEKSDNFFRNLVSRVSPHSPIIARTIADGNYLRAMFGSTASLLLLPGAALGLIALNDTSGQALPPATWIVMAIIALAVLDAMAGFMSGLIFALGVILTGNFTSRDEVLTVAGLFILFYAPSLLASSIRPLRRLAKDRDSLWERATDYGLVTLLSGWTISKMIGGLNALAGVQLLITFDAAKIGYWTSIFVLVRLVLEDFATYRYPVRINQTSGEMKEPDTVHKIIALELKIFIFVELAMPFVGYNIKLLLGTLIFITPSIIGIFFDDRLPKFRFLHRILPSGAFKLVAMVFIGAIAAGWIQGLFSDPRTFLAWSFVVLAIPGLILSLLNKMSDDPEKDWKVTPMGNTAYRILGVIVFLLIVQIVRGVDLYAVVFGK